MSAIDDAEDQLLGVVLAATPDRVIETVMGPSAEGAAALEGMRATLASMGEALEPVATPPGGRSRFAARLEAAVVERERPASKRALLVLDMITDYLTPGRPLFVPRARAIIPALRDRLAQARAAGDDVLFVCDRHAADDPELDVWPQHAVEGTDGSQVVPELAPLPSETVVAHRTYSAFFESELERTLRERSIETLVITGCATEISLLATATDALMRGFKVEVPPSCQAGTTELAERVALGVLHVMRPVEPMRAR